MCSSDDATVASRLGGVFASVMPRDRRPGRVLSGLTAAVLVTGLLTACSSVGDLVAQQASDTACTAITPVVDQVTADVQAAVAQISVDPTAAIDTLQTANVLLATLPGQSEAVDSATTTIEALISQAQSVQRGQRIDQRQVDDLSAQLTQALAGATGVC